MTARTTLIFPRPVRSHSAVAAPRYKLRGEQIVNETVWNDQPNGGAGGGGVSDVFPLPSWQHGFDVPSPTVKAGGRGVPDVAGDADPNTGYNILVDGETCGLRRHQRGCASYGQGWWRESINSWVNNNRGKPSVS